MYFMQKGLLHSLQPFGGTRQIYLEVTSVVYPFFGERGRKQKISTYAPAQDHYGDCIQGLICFVTDS
jgi:hypothetical protein